MKCPIWIPNLFPLKGIPFSHHLHWNFFCGISSSFSFSFIFFFTITKTKFSYLPFSPSISNTSQNHPSSSFSSSTCTKSPTKNGILNPNPLSTSTLHKTISMQYKSNRAVQSSFINKAPNYKKNRKWRKDGDGVAAEKEPQKNQLLVVMMGRDWVL